MIVLNFIYAACIASHLQSVYFTYFFIFQLVNETWGMLKQLSQQRKQVLEGDHEIQKFKRAVEETATWIKEKSNAVLSDDYGRDLASVQALLRKHTGLERELDALEIKVTIIIIIRSNDVHVIF